MIDVFPDVQFFAQAEPAAAVVVSPAPAAVPEDPNKYVFATKVRSFEQLLRSL